MINIRIMVEDRLTNEQAKELVFDFFDEIERGITDLNLFRKSYQINFDIKGKEIKVKSRFGGSSKRQGHRITVYSRFGRKAASVRHQVRSGFREAFQLQGSAITGHIRTD